MLRRLRSLVPIFALVWLLMLLAVPAVTPTQAGGKNLDAFAKCLTDKKATMYGVFWCEHCAEQKEMFGSSFQYVTYVECGLKGRQITDQCKAMGIKRTPTWVFANGDRLDGRAQPLEVLSQKTGCPLP